MESVLFVMKDCWRGVKQLAADTKLPGDGVHPPRIGHESLDFLHNSIDAAESAFAIPYSSLILVFRTCILVGMLQIKRRSSHRTARLRDPERTRARLLRAAFQEMHHSGFRSADLDAILAKAGVTKGALYYHFENKEALGYAVVDEVMASKVHQKWVHPVRNAKNPIDVLIRIFQSESLKKEDVQRGCYLLNLSQEMSGLDEGFRRRTARIYKDWHDAMAEALREGQKCHVVRSDINASETASFLIAAWEGYAVLGKNSQDPRLMRSGQRSIIRHLEALRPARGRRRATGPG